MSPIGFTSSMHDQSFIVQGRFNFEADTPRIHSHSKLELDSTKPASLPSELVHTIFLYALRSLSPLQLDEQQAEDGPRRNFASTLCLVASWTRELALPYLLRAIVIRDPAKALALSNVLSESTDERDGWAADFIPLRWHPAWSRTESLWIEGWAPGMGEIFRTIGGASARWNGTEKDVGLKKVALGKEGFEELLLHYQPFPPLSYSGHEGRKGLQVTILPSSSGPIFTPPTRISGITQSTVYSLITHLILPLPSSGSASSPSSLLASLPLSRLPNLCHLLVQTSLTNGMYDFLSPQILLHPSLRKSNTAAGKEGMLVVAFNERGYPGGMLESYKRNLREVRERLVKDERLWFIQLDSRPGEEEYFGDDVWEKARVWTEGLLRDPRYA